MILLLIGGTIFFLILAYQIIAPWSQEMEDLAENAKMWVAITVIIMSVLLSGCGDSSENFEDYYDSDRLEASALSKLEPVGFAAPKDLEEKLHDQCTEAKMLEAESVYSDCYQIYSTSGPFDPETHCQANYDTNVAKIETNWNQIYLQSNAFLKACLTDVAFLDDQKSIEAMKKSCYAEFERVFLLRISSCQSVYLNIF
jgi:hypothetical protein